MYTQNVSVPPDYFTWRCDLPAKAENSHNWRDDDTERIGKIQCPK